MTAGARVGLALAAAALALVACRAAPRPDGPPVRRGFYYWRTTLALAPAERRALVDLHIDRLYLRMFDVAWQDDGPTTLGAITAAAGQALPAGIEVVPVVYFTNEVFAQLPANGVGALADTTWRDVQDRATRLGFVPRELQLDCDWTDATRDRFFGFVTALRGTVGAGTTLSATIRLHQVKYRERTGVPPVDRGMLMFYNMGRFSADPDARAIFDGKTAALYLARLADYPLPLDGALPIWSWTIHLRDEQVEGLLQSTDADDLAGLDFVRADGPGRYQVTRTTFLHGTLVRAGDVLKVEVTGPAETQAAASMLAAHLAAVATPRTIALFDLSERNLARHDLPHLDRVFQTVR